MTIAFISNPRFSPRLRAIPALLAVMVLTHVFVFDAGNASAVGSRSSRIVDGPLIHLRSGATREWDTFEQDAQRNELSIHFEGQSNESPSTLTLRQQDVRERWDVRLNDQVLGQLVRDENDLRCDFEIKPGVLQSGTNHLQIIPAKSKVSDDIRVGEIDIHDIAPTTLRMEAILEVVITDEDDKPMPGRVTIVDREGALVPVGLESNEAAAVREGVVYTSSGIARFGLQSGEYVVMAGRGFEYGLGRAKVRLGPGEVAKRTFQLVREVDTSGWVACDTHVHTVTHSGHGDCTIDERMMTLAGEAIELPIATDHNKQIDYAETSRRLGTSRWFTSVVGNEVTTKRGHFNVFPTTATQPIPDFQAETWSALFDSVFSPSSPVRIAILNHGRDLHSDFRPLSPRHHLSLAGINLDQWDQRYNAMELINSGAVQTDPMQLFTDWCGMINHGRSVTPVGSSDSHDVSRYIVGQGRTYIRCRDDSVDKIDVPSAVETFLRGSVVVSYGLFADVVVNAVAGPGDTVQLPDGDALVVSATVRGPSWSNVSDVQLWVNGVPCQLAPEASKRVDQPSGDEAPLGVLRKVEWKIPASEIKHDSWLTVVARGPGIQSPHWPCAKPYQPDSPHFESYVFSCTGPIKIDRNGDGSYASPSQTASRLLEEVAASGTGSEPDWNELAGKLDSVDLAVANQVLAAMQMKGQRPGPLWEAASPELRSRMHRFDGAWRESVRARLENLE